MLCCCNWAAAVQLHTGFACWVVGIVGDVHLSLVAGKALMRGHCYFFTNSSVLLLTALEGAGAISSAGRAALLAHNLSCFQQQSLLIVVWAWRSVRTALSQSCIVQSGHAALVGSCFLDIMLQVDQVAFTC
jgi:hypothetical protein